MEAPLERFMQFLSVKSVHPYPDYKGCVEWIQRQAQEIDGLEVKVYHCVAEKPVVVATLMGQNPELPSILLNSHMDVVPVDQTKWSTEDPFTPVLKDGKIIGRGTQDMKCK